MMFPAIPDNLSKFFIFAGIVLIGYAFFEGLNERKEYNAKINQSNARLDSIEIKKIIHDKKKEILLETASELSQKYNLKNPILVNDSVIYFNITLTGDENEIRISDSLRLLWREYKNGQFEIELLNQMAKMTKSNLDHDAAKDNELQTFYALSAGFGLILLVTGIAGMQKIQSLQEKQMIIDVELKGGKYSYCQSCGKNFSSVRQPGRNEKLEPNPAFCIECFDNGKFKEPSLTREEFKRHWLNVISSYKSGKDKKKLLNRFESLERWKEDEYL